MHQRACGKNDCEAPSDNSAKTHEELLAELYSTQGESPIDSCGIVGHEPPDCGESDGKDQQNEMLDSIVHGCILHSQLA
jgi:hypothetical protein